MSIPYPSSSLFPGPSLIPDQNPVGFSASVWSPECVGNGRLLIQCAVSESSSFISTVQWQINNNGWVTAATNPGTPSQFSFWVYGDDPLPGTEVLPQWSLEGTYYEAAVDREVVRVTRAGILVPRADSEFDAQNVAGRWFWEDGVLTYNTENGQISDLDVVVTTPAFSEGKKYTLRVRVNGFTVLTEEFTWHWPVRDTVGHIIDTAAPSFLAEVQAARDIYFAHGRFVGDLYSTFDDYSFQCYPSLATWSIPIWEAFLGLPSIISLTTAERRTIIEETVRANGGLRTEFINAVATKAGSSPSVIDDYANYSVVIRLPINGAEPDSEKYRAAAESVISRIKPSGINTSVSYATFIAGISKAGDAL